MQAVLQDFRYAVKQLRKNLGFSIVVILTLALSIGANTAIFSVVDALLLRPLPYPQPERLASLQIHLSNRPNGDRQPNWIDRETWRQLHDAVPAVTAAVSSGTSGVNLQADGRALFVHGERVSASYFDVLGLHPMFGRGFTAAEDTAGGPLSVVLSYGLWSGTFASNPNILGQAIQLKGVPYTVIGVLAPETQTPNKVDLWTSLRPDTSQEGGGDNYDPILRLKDGATWQQADAQLQQVQSMTTRYVAEQFGGRAVYQVLPLQQGLASADRTPVLILMAAVGFVLLVASANLAGLALVRIGRRQSEIATRLALGASRWAILRQFWIESILLTTLGVLAALLLGKFTLRFINQRIPAGFLPVGGVSLDARVLLFAAAAGVAASLFFGLLPALSARRIDVRSAMTSSSRAVTQSGGTRTRFALIIGEVALTVVLLTSAGLLIRTLVYLRTLPPGFNPRNVVVAKASLDDARYNTQAAFLKLLDKSIAALRAIPGVEAAGVGLTVPYEKALNYQVTVADGLQAGRGVMTNLVYVTPGYFETLQVALRAGRLFSEGDTPSSHDVSVVNETFARKYLESENAVGRHVKSDKIATEVVGIVDNVVAQPGLAPGAPITSEPTMYLPATQMPTGTVNVVHIWFQPSWVVRSKGKLSGVTQRIQEAMARVDPNLPVSGFYAMNDVLVETLVLQHMEVGLLSTLAGLALLLSAVGIYGLVSNLVNQRTREFGIRMALGCTVRGAMALASRSGIFATATGLVAGLLLSLLAVKVLQSQLFGVGLYDPPTLCAVSALLLGVALLATILPAFRIARIDPAETLRAE